jgi:CxxC motif-containing protein (DUF1111 family)
MKPLSFNRWFLSACAPLVGACWSSLADTPSRPVDPGVRAGAVDAGDPVSGVNAQYFHNVQRAFNQVHSIAGDLESGVGLGPRFNGTSCGGCHAYPSPGGSSPKQNPQLAMAGAHGATNSIPAFVRVDGPVLAVRVKKAVGSVESGGVLPLFTVSGRSDAYRCALMQPSFSDAANLSIRISTPLFGAGLIDNISDDVILANQVTKKTEKQSLGIEGRPNIGATGAVGKFGWKAQHHSLTSFAEEAYQTEMGVHAGGSYSRREPLNQACYALYDAAYEDPNFAPSYDQNEGSSVFPFTEFMRFLEAPRPVSEFAGVGPESIRNGRYVFDSVGCALCHTPALRSGDQSNLPALNERNVPLYSDLLLHHMGAKLADGIVQGRAESDEFRTTPLWGVGQRVFFMHDGRTTDLLIAILDHASDGAGGRSEANAVIDRFRRLSPLERQDVLNFLRSL